MEGIETWLAGEGVIIGRCGRGGLACVRRNTGCHELMGLLVKYITFTSSFLWAFTFMHLGSFVHFILKCST